MNKLPFARCVEVVERVLAGDSVRTIEAQGLAAKNTTDRITMEMGLWSEGMGVGRERVRQIEDDALRRLRKSLAPFAPAAGQAGGGT